MKQQPNKQIHTSKDRLSTNHSASHSTIVDTNFRNIPLSTSTHQKIYTEQPQSRSNYPAAMNHSLTRRSSIQGSIKFKPNINMFDKPMNTTALNTATFLNQQPSSKNVSLHISPKKQPLVLSHQPSPSSTSKQLSAHRSNKQVSSTFGGAMSQLSMLRSQNCSPKQSIFRDSNPQRSLQKGVFSNIDMKSTIANFSAKSKGKSSEQQEQQKQHGVTVKGNCNNSILEQLKCSLSSHFSQTGPSTLEIDPLSIVIEPQSNQTEWSFYIEKGRPQDLKHKIPMQFTHRKSYSLTTLYSGTLQTDRNLQNPVQQLKQQIPKPVQKHDEIIDPQSPSKQLMRIMKKIKDNESIDKYYQDLMTIYQNMFEKKPEVKQPKQKSLISKTDKVSIPPKNREKKPINSCSVKLSDHIDYTNSNVTEIVDEYFQINNEVINKDAQIHIDKLIDIQKYIGDQLLNKLDEEKKERLLTEQRISRMLMDKEVTIYKMENQLQSEVSQSKPID